MYCHHHLTQVWRNWSLAKWEIISKLAEHFFWLWQNWRLCPAKLLRRFGEIGGCGCWKLSPKLRSCQTTVETEFGGEIGDYLQTRQIFDEVDWPKWRSIIFKPRTWLSLAKLEIISKLAKLLFWIWGNWRWGKLNIISQIAELLLGFGILPSHVVRPLAWRLQNVPKCNRNNPNAKVINGGEPCFSCLACTAGMGVQPNTLKRICKWGPTPVKVNM